MPVKTPPELLAPAGSLKMAQAAFDYGANAIYCGQPRYSLRVRNNEFGDPGKLETAIGLAHARGGQCYVVSNIVPHNAKLATYLADMAPVIAMRPDALIMADPGLMLMIRETWPEMPIHLSVQANTLNHAAVRFWQSVGVSRVILSRELSLDDIAEIRQRCPEMELEVFVHGALCVAYSGRCLLSGYFNHRDPNQGTCTNACRWSYDAKPAAANATGDVVLIEEATRPGELMPMEEDEHGTYILNSKDLRAIEYIDRLVAIGVDSLKIEGRTKSAYYVARTCQAYRRAIDDALAGRAFDAGLVAQLDDLASRGYTAGFYERHPDREYQNYLSGLSQMGASQYVGDVTGYVEGLAEIDVKNRFAVGDRLEIIHPAGNAVVTVERMEKVGAGGTASAGPAANMGMAIAMDVAPGNGHVVRIPLPPGKEGAFLARLGSNR
ncbi:MAG: U32 family peptidase [Rhodocyclaceae bacterium]|jgi:putative protease|nr:U32 family peptidase [Rhodocyclaceae bacterium]